jgi:hypothetical protein
MTHHILALTTGNPVHLISTKAHGGCDRSAEDAYSSMAPDPNFAFVGGLCCLTLDFVFAIWILITFYTLLTSLFCIYTRSIVTGLRRKVVECIKCSWCASDQLSEVFRSLDQLSKPLHPSYTSDPICGISRNQRAPTIHLTSPLVYPEVRVSVVT